MRRRQIGLVDRVLHGGDRGRRLLVERQVERREIREVLARRLNANQLAREAVDFPFLGLRVGRIRSRVATKTRVDQRKHRVAPLRGQVQFVDGGRQDFGRSRFQLEKDAQRIGQIGVGKIAEHRAVRVSIEQARQDGSPQQVLTTSGSRSRTARESFSNMTRARRGSSAENSVVTSENFRSSAVSCWFSDGSSSVRRRSRPDRRDCRQGPRGPQRDVSRCAPGQDEPSPCQADTSSRRGRPRQRRLTPSLFVLDQIADRGRRRTDVEYFRLVRHQRNDGVDAVLGQQLGERGRALGERAALVQRCAKAREVARRRVPAEIEGGDMRRCRRRTSSSSTIVPGRSRSRPGSARSASPEAAAVPAGQWRRAPCVRRRWRPRRAGWWPGTCGTCGRLVPAEAEALRLRQSRPAVPQTAGFQPCRG